MSNDMHEQTVAASAVIKNAPPVLVTGLSFLGLPLQDWVYLATLSWIAYQFTAAVYDRFFRGRE